MDDTAKIPGRNGEQLVGSQKYLPNRSQTDGQAGFGYFFAGRWTILPRERRFLPYDRSKRDKR